MKIIFRNESSAPLHNLSKLYGVPFGFVTPLIFLHVVPKGSCWLYCYLKIGVEKTWFLHTMFLWSFQTIFQKLPSGAPLWIWIVKMICISFWSCNLTKCLWRGSPTSNFFIQSACTSMCRRMYNWNIVECDLSVKQPIHSTTSL